MRINSFFTKLLLIFSVLMLTYFYAQYERRKYYFPVDSTSNGLVLKQLPVFESVEISSGNVIRSNDFLKGSRGLFVHIWGSWCAPCEKEMPDFLKYAESVQNMGIKFLLIAVNDEEPKVKKFMGRFSIPKNVVVTIDKLNITMDLFGTLKVPESFLFDNTGKHINKFAGPQEWLQESYKTRLDFWLNPGNLVERKIETH